MVGVCAIKLQLRLQGHAVGEASFKALGYGVTGRIDVVIEKLQHEIIAGVGNWEVLRKHLVKALVLALLGGSVELQEVAERLELHLQKIRERQRILDRREVDTRLFGKIY